MLVKVLTNTDESTESRPDQWTSLEGGGFPVFAMNLADTLESHITFATHCKFALAFMYLKFEHIASSLGLLESDLGV